VVYSGIVTKITETNLSTVARFIYWTMNTLYCKGYIKPSYPVYLSTDGDMSDISNLLPRTKKRFVVIDEKLLSLFPRLTTHLKGDETYIFPVTATERNKSLNGLCDLFDEIFALKPSRDDILIAVGGGLVMNLGGLAASLIMRGIRFYYVPTTLTGQIDASMGSKQAVNFRGAKNWLGMFNDPEFCYINPSFLKTTPLREFNSQAIEGVKLCLATDKHLFNEVFKSLDGLYDAPAPELTSFIEKMIKAKIAVVGKDLTEDHYGMSMLYGHTVGHAIEMLDHDNINHGEGVGLGMLVAARISHMLGIADESLVTTHEEVLKRLGLPSKIPSHIAPTDIIEKLGHNKKNYGGEVRFVLLKDIGQMANNNEDYFNVVPSGVISAAIKKGY